MAKYLVTHEVYERYGNSGIKMSRFDADSDVEALLKVNDNCMYRYEDKNGYEYGDEEFTMPSLDDMIDRICSMNGDGCDYILRIENLDNQSVLFEDENYVIEDETW